MLFHLYHLPHAGLSLGWRRGAPALSLREHVRLAPSARVRKEEGKEGKGRRFIKRLRVGREKGKACIYIYVYKEKKKSERH